MKIWQPCQTYLKRPAVVRFTGNGFVGQRFAPENGQRKASHDGGRKLVLDAGILQVGNVLIDVLVGGVPIFEGCVRENGRTQPGRVGPLFVHHVAQLVPFGVFFAQDDRGGWL